MKNIGRGDWVITISSLGFYAITRNILVNDNLTFGFTLIENMESLNDVSVEEKIQRYQGNISAS